jgi:hypothetical protein
VYAFDTVVTWHYRYLNRKDLQKTEAGYCLMTAYFSGSTTVTGITVNDVTYFRQNVRFASYY